MRRQERALQGSVAGKRKPEALALTCALLLLLSGCRNKLLSPTECEYLAQRLSGITAPHQLRNPRLRAEVIDRAEHCLLAPYDREFVRCLEKRGRLDLCEKELEGRMPR